MGESSSRFPMGRNGQVLKFLTSQFFGRLFFLMGMALLLILWTWEVQSEGLTIIEVRTNIPLAEKDPMYRDFFINSGYSAGLKKNMKVTALRKTVARDATGTQSYGDVKIPVGFLKIIFVGEKFSVAREVSLLPRDNLPMLEQTGIMIGDQVELKGATVDNRPFPREKKSEEASEVTSQEVDKK